jgi:hypothetical protein
VSGSVESAIRDPTCFCDWEAPYSIASSPASHPKVMAEAKAEAKAEAQSNKCTEKLNAGCPSTAGSSLANHARDRPKPHPGQLCLLTTRPKQYLKKAFSWSSEHPLRIGVGMSMDPGGHGTLATESSVGRAQRQDDFTVPDRHVRTCPYGASRC